MRRLVVLAVTLAAAAACAPTRVPVEIDWTFGGQFCDQAGVTTIQIDIDGEVLDRNQFTCGAPDHASQGVGIGDFLTGPYRVTITGLDADGNVIYQGTQTIQVHGGQNNVFTIDAAPTTGTATLHWTWGGRSCAAAGVTSVQISVDDQVITGQAGFPCTSSGPNGAPIDGTTIGPLGPGNHTVGLAANGSGNTYYAVEGATVSVTVGQDSAYDIDVPAATPTTASADVRWTFSTTSATGLNCSQVGVDHIYLYFDNGAAPIADTACTGISGPVSEMSIVDVPDGQHTFAIHGTRGGQLVYYTHHPVQTLFQAPFTTAVDVTAEPTP